MDTIEAIQNRRSIRKYRTDPVDEKTLRTVLEAGRLAPSWSNTQCWKFVIVRDSETKNKLAETISAPPGMPANPALNAIRTAPVVIVACAEKGKAGYFEGKAATDKGEYWYMFDVALAMENMMLAATSLGLGTVHVGLFDNKKAEEILGVPQGYCVIEMSPLGYPEYQPNPRPRKDAGEIFFFEKFGRQ